MRLLIAAILSVAGASFVHLTAARAHAHDDAVGVISVAHPIVAPPPNGRTTTAGYMVLRNGGDEADRLVSASSPGAERIEIHTVDHGAGGVMTMRELEDGVVIPAHGEVAFAPHQLHLMVIGLRAPLQAGDRLALRLTFERAGSVDVVASVERPSASGHNAHQH